MSLTQTALARLFEAELADAQTALRASVAWNKLLLVHLNVLLLGICCRAGARATQGVTGHGGDGGPSPDAVTPKRPRPASCTGKTPSGRWRGNGAEEWAAADASDRLPASAREESGSGWNVAW